MARSGQSDAIDATVVCLAADGDDILTSDPGGLRVLAGAADIHVELIPVWPGRGCVSPREPAWNAGPSASTIDHPSLRSVSDS